jgi:beta-1,4-mannooligosaccharide/beta-1,4-mannosyl-N-acetylglucosamine phosphorylase
MLPTPLRSSPVITRHAANPLLASGQVPYPSTCVFNAGVDRWQGRYVMVFRNDIGAWGSPVFTETNLGLAWSADGVRWTVEPSPFYSMAECASLLGEEAADVLRFYDPRVTVIDGVPYLCFAVDTHHGVRGGIARIRDDFSGLAEVLSLSAPDNRNMVLFPHLIGGRFHRLERPFPVYSRGRDRFDMWYGSSADLRCWGEHHLVLGVEHVPYANDKIGPAAPPVLTRAGWLCIFHAVDRDEGRGRNGWEQTWKKRYCAGICLLDREQPWKVVGMSKEPLIAPEAPYEVDGGFRNDVIFPTGLVLEDSGEVKIWYGAADTVVALATAHVDDLIRICASPR